MSAFHPKQTPEGGSVSGKEVGRFASTRSAVATGNCTPRFESVSHDVASLREYARHCRELAEALIDLDAIKLLLQMADELDLEADRLLHLSGGDISSQHPERP